MSFLSSPRTRLRTAQRKLESRRVHVNEACTKSSQNREPLTRARRTGADRSLSSRASRHGHAQRTTRQPQPTGRRTRTHGHALLASGIARATANRSTVRSSAPEPGSARRSAPRASGVVALRLRRPGERLVRTRVPDDDSCRIRRPSVRRLWHGRCTESPSRKQHPGGPHAFDESGP